MTRGFAWALLVLSVTPLWGCLDMEAAPQVPVAPPPGPPPTGRAPWIEEDFSSYTSSLQLITAPKAGWMIGGWQYPGYPKPQGSFTHTTDQDIALDRTKGYGGLTQSMRYTFPAFSGRTPQFDYQIRLGGLRLPSVITAGHELWVEWVVMFDPSFNTNSGQAYGTDYKFFFVHALPDGSGRTEVKVGSGTVGEAGNRSAINTGRHFSTNVQGNTPDRWTFDVPDFGANFRGVWDGQWHVYRLYMKVSSTAGVPDGIFRVWVDGALYVNKTGIPYSVTAFDALSPGNNNNQGPSQSASVWWGRIRAWNADPGW